jgi:hypothetical protein
MMTASPSHRANSSGMERLLAVFSSLVLRSFP